MFKKFNNHDFTWDSVDTLVYKQDQSPFKDVTRQVLFDGAWDLPCQFRYFEVKPGGYSTMEYHNHTHMVLIFRGKGQCLLGEKVIDVQVGDYVEISGGTIHQFRANKGDYLGFLCLVNIDRDKVQVVGTEQMEEMKKKEHIRKFLED